MQTRISVITINFNNKEGLQQTINSVVTQTYPCVEYIVIDGGSTDGSADLLNNGSIHYAISEPDAGIYDAMNKGILKATGEFCLFLNSGDFFCNKDTLASAMQLIEGNGLHGDIYYGHLIINGQDVKYPETDLELLLHRTVPHQASFIKTDLFSKGVLGLYNTHYRIVSDWIFFIKAYINQKKFIRIDIPIAVFDTSGISSVDFDLNSTERYHALQHVYPNFIVDTIKLGSLKSYANSRSHQYLKRLMRFVKRRKG